MCECVNAIVGLIGMVERSDLWNRKGSPIDRRGVPSAWPTRATDLWVENQQLAILHGLHAQYAGFQETCNCYKEGTTKGERMRECVNV